MHQVEHYNSKYCVIIMFTTMTRISQVNLRSAELTDIRYNKGIYVKYTVMGDDEITESNIIVGTLTPKLKHRRVVAYSRVTTEHLEFFEMNCITFFIYGVQADGLPDKRYAKMTTRVGTSSFHFISFHFIFALS